MNNFSDDYQDWFDYEPQWPTNPPSSVSRDGPLIREDTRRSPEISSPERPETTCSSPSPPDSPLETMPAENLELPAPSTSGLLQTSAMLLTWSRSPSLTKQLIREHLATFSTIECLRVGAEHHQDGELHHHAFVKWTTRVRRAPSAFAIAGHHPNCRIHNPKMGTLAVSLKNMWDYVGKEDQNPLEEGSPPQGQKRTRNQVFAEAILTAQTTSVEAAMTLLQTASPYEVATRYDAIQRSLTSVRNKKVRTDTPARPLEMFRMLLPVPEEWHCLFIWGKSGVGKTQYARALLPEASVIRHRNQLMDADFSKGIIFDDFDVSHWPPTAVIHLLDWDERSGIDVKHGHAMIPPHTRRIFTYNNDPCHWYPPGCSPEQVAAILRRMHVIEINTKLY